MNLAKPGDVVQLVGRDKKYFIFRLTPGARLDTHRGNFQHDQLIGQELGTEVFTHLGHPYFLLIPSTDDLIRDLKRSSQIIYPKDSGFILMKLSLKPGQTVLEAGTGSGGMTTILAQIVGPTGRVVSYDVRSDMQRTAARNLERLGLSERVELKLRDIAAGFDERDVDAFFLDVPNPWDYVAQVRQALKGGGFFGCIVPTTNQVSTLLSSMMRDGYEFIEVCEILLRYYKTVPERVRPTDRMVAHTGFLIFGRPVTRRAPPPAPANLDAQGSLEALRPERAAGEPVSVDEVAGPDAITEADKPEAPEDEDGDLPSRRALR